LRADSSLGQETAQPLGIAGNEAQGLNGNDFSGFVGVLNRLFQVSVCLSVNLCFLVPEAIMPESFAPAQASGNQLAGITSSLNGLERIWR
jgi:hypothetical protein